MAAASKESSLLTSALAELASVSRKHWRRRESRHPMRDFLETRGWLVSKERIAKLGEGNEHCVSIPSGGRNEVLLLPPIVGQPKLVALLAVRWCFEKKASRGSFRIFFVFLDEGEQDKIQEPVTPFVMRFDDMEGQAGWRFGHAQLTDTMTPYDSWMKNVDVGNGSVPSTVPRVPLASLQRNASSVLMCIVASIYGTDSSVFSSVGRCVAASSETSDVMKKLAFSEAK